MPRSRAARDTRAISGELKRVAAEPPLRGVTWLVPGLPEVLFQLVIQRLGDCAGRVASLRVEAGSSGPARGGPHPFNGGGDDIGFLCAPSFVWLSRLRPPAVQLLAAPVFDDPRNGGRPTYFSDVVVREDSAAHRLEDLLTARWAFNDHCSLSGWFSIWQELPEHAGVSLQRAGSHDRALDLLLAGEVDAAAVDANVLARRRRERGPVAVRAVATWGPYPVQPVVARHGLDRGLVATLRATLQALHTEPATAAALRELGVVRFCAVGRADYAPLAAALRRSEGLQSAADPALLR